MVSMANHLLQVEKAWLLSQIGALYTCRYKLALLIQQSYVLFKVLSPTAMMMSWTKYVSMKFQSEDTRYLTLPFNSKNGVLVLGYYYGSL